METLGLSSGAAGLISLGISVCHGLLDYHRSWKDAEDQVAHMHASIEALFETFRLLENAIQSEMFRHDSVQKVEKSIRSAERGLQSLRKKLDKVRLTPSQPRWKAKGMAQFRRTLFPFKESTLAKLKELGIELRRDLALALEVLQIECAAASSQKMDLLVHNLDQVSVDIDILKDESTFISKNVQRLEAFSRNTSKSVDGSVATQSNEFCRKVYDWLSPLTAEFQKKHLDTFNIQGRQDSAAQSLLETTQFRHWLGTSGETLWCPGIQGTGKTIFASYIINHLQGLVDQKDTRLCYFYLSYKDSERQSVQNLLMSLICQLSLLESALPAELKALYEAHVSESTRPSHAECMQLLKFIVGHCSKFFLVIDAFDEYPEDCRGQLLTELRHSKARINLLIMSRNLPTIERQLSKAVRLDVQASSKDILQYLRERIASSERLKSHTHKDPALCNLISTTIATRAAGMFLQARLHLEFLTTKTTLRKLKNALTTLPEGLNNTYDETMERINSQYPDQATLARKVLCWVFHASRPLTMSEIQHALAVEIGDSTLDEDNIPEKELLLSVCNGLVTYGKEGGFLALVHYTFQQYLEQKAENLFPEAQVEIVRTCLTYLSFDEYEQGPCHEVKDFTLRLKRWPLLSYAVLKWGQHARQGAEEACRDLIVSFLSQDAKVSASVQVLWVTVLVGVDYPRRFPSRVSPLWLASFYGLTYTVSHLLASQRHSVNRKTTWGDTALHRAAGCGNSEILKLLLSNGADVTARDRVGNTSLHLASFFWSDIFATDMCTSNGRQTRDWIEQKAKISGMSLSVTRLLLDHGADVNAANPQGETPLHLSVIKRQKALTQLLLACGADVTLKDRYRVAPLTLASRIGDEEITQILLEHNVERQVQCGIPNDAMRTAASKDQLPMLELLLSRFPEQRSPDPEGRNLLHISARGGSLRCLEYLENSGSDLEALDKQKRTCLHIAATGKRAGSRAVLKYLLERGLNPSQSDVDGWTPLLWAAKAGNTINVQMLLDAGADSFYQGDKEWVPYIVAAYHENHGAAAILKLSDRPLPEMFQRKNSSMSLRHSRIICDGCELSIIGSRYKCSECPDVDYCFKCVLSADVTHPCHRFEVIYWDDSNQDVKKMERQEVIEELTARETLMKSCKA